MTLLLRRLLAALSVAILSAVSAPPVVAADEKPPAKEAKLLLPDDAAAAWKAVLEATRPPTPPAEWNQQRPTQEEYEAFRRKMGEAAAQAADKAKEFFTRFPDDANAAEAKTHHKQMLTAAVQLGVKERAEELAALRSAGAAPAASAAPSPGKQAKDAEDPAEDIFTAKMEAAIKKSLALEEKGTEAVFGEFEKQLRELQKEFPDREEIFLGLMEVAGGLGNDRSVVIYKEIAASKASERIKEAAADELKRLEQLGRPLELKFKAVDGREVDLAKLKGKVVLIDFWATWCGPCIAELPNVLAAYEKLHDQGFEIVGISLDHEREVLENFVKRKKMSWPHYFDGQGWENPHTRRFGITGIPAMWLVDKQGVLRDMNARGGLAAKVEKLLAEK